MELSFSHGPDTQPKWEYVDHPPNAAAEETASVVFRRLVNLDHANPLRFRFEPEAQQLFIEWLGDLESRLRGDKLHPALISHLAKYRKLVPALALLFELADRAAAGFDGLVGTYAGASPDLYVSIEHTQQAAAWSDYLESHANRVYSCDTAITI